MTSDKIALMLRLDDRLLELRNTCRLWDDQRANAESYANSKAAADESPRLLVIRKERQEEHQRDLLSRVLDAEHVAASYQNISLLLQALRSDEQCDPVFSTDLPEDVQLKLAEMREFARRSSQPLPAAMRPASPTA
ncbi:hypothetical protein [Roseinatronobacter sp.]